MVENQELFNTTVTATTPPTITTKQSKYEARLKLAIFALCIFSFFCIVLCIYVGYRKHCDRMQPIYIEETEETFYVQKNNNEEEWVSHEAAKRLNRLASKGDQIVNYMVQRKLPSKEIAQRLAKRWKHVRNNPKGLRETGRNESSAAYTVNKGDELRICIRDETSGKLFEEENTGFLVLLHELAHLMSKTYGHGGDFPENYRVIAKTATNLGLYNYVDYSKYPTTYCGTKISNPPF